MNNFNQIGLICHNLFNVFVRRGYFVDGLGGNQFALPEVVDRLRAIRDVDGHASQFACLDPVRPTRCQECPGPGVCAAQVVLNQMGLASQRVLENLTLADLMVPQLEASNQ